MANVDTKLRQDTTQIPVADPLPPSVLGYLASCAMTAVATVIAIGIDSGVTVPNVSLVFIVPVIIAGVAFGLGPSLFSAVLGALVYNFFLTEPRYSLAVDNPANIWAIGLLFLVGLIVSSIAFTSRQRATDAALLTRQAAVLQGYSRDVVVADNAKAVASTTSQALAALFQVPAVVMLVAEGNVVSVNSVGGLEPQQAEVEAARSSLEMGAVMRAGIYPTLASRFDFWPVATAAGPDAIIGLALDPDNRPLAPDRVVDVVGSLLALALYRQQVSRADSPTR